MSEGLAGSLRSNVSSPAPLWRKRYQKKVLTRDGESAYVNIITITLQFKFTRAGIVHLVTVMQSWLNSPEGNGSFSPEGAMRSRPVELNMLMPVGLVEAGHMFGVCHDEVELWDAFPSVTYGLNNKGSPFLAMT